MNSTPPFIAQERADACAIACLRMLLAHQGIEISEDRLVAQASLVQGGLDPDMLIGLARHYGLGAKARQLDLNAIAALVEQGAIPHCPRRTHFPGWRLCHPCSHP